MGLLDFLSGDALKAAALAAGAALAMHMPWSLLMLPLSALGIKVYQLRDRETCTRVQKRLAFGTHTTEDGLAQGYSVGRWYVAHCNTNRGPHDAFSVWLVATEGSYKALSQETVTEPYEDGAADGTFVKAACSSAPSSLQIYERSGSLASCWYRKRLVPLQKMQPRPAQQQILDAILSLYRRQRHAVAYVYGPAGTGKSMLGPFLANALGANFCNTLRPWEPGCSLADLYLDSDASEKMPLVLAMDEIDCALIQIHAGIPAHKAIPIAVRDKSGWNRLFDEVSRGMFPFLVILLTSNKCAAFVNDLDPSYLRPGRVDLTVALE